MSKKFKRLSAAILAVVMMLGSTVMASAATMHIYIREWEQGTSSNTYLGTPKPISGITNPVVTVTGVDPNGTYKDALDLADTKNQLSVTWNKKANEYLTAPEVPGYRYPRCRVLKPCRRRCAAYRRKARPLHWCCPEKLSSRYTRLSRQEVPCPASAEARSHALFRR